MGSQLLCLVLSILISVKAHTVDINEIVDAKLELINSRTISAGKTTIDFGSDGFNSVRYEGATAIGMDTLNRTGDCSMVFNGNSITYNYQVGQLIHAVYFRLATYFNETGSGYYRAWDNSLNYSYTVYYGSRCTVKLNELKISLDIVEACLQSKCSTSKTDANLATIVEKQLMPALNSKLASLSAPVKKKLNGIYCQSNSENLTQDQITNGLDVLTAFILE